MTQLRWTFLAVLGVALLLSFTFGSVTFGISQQWTNGQYHFAGGTHPAALALAAVIIVLYLLLMFASAATLGDPFPGVLRRLVAFWLDFILAIMVVGPVIGILPTLTEWKRTGLFEWNFARTTQAPGDGWLTLTGLIISFVALVFYFAFPLTRCRPSPGACITGYQIVPDHDVAIHARAAVLRTLLGFLAACAAYVAPFIARDRKKGKFWLDAVFGTRALTLR